jgi:hypothetical protein
MEESCCKAVEASKIGRQTPSEEQLKGETKGIGLEMAV